MSFRVEPQRLLALQFPATARRAPVLDRRPLATAALASATLAAVFLVVLLTGGTPSALSHLAYVPVTIAAYRSGARGGLLAGLAAMVMLGPAMYWADLERDGEWGLPWLVRGAFFAGAGALVGWLFDRSRSAISAWRGAALEATRHHYEAMESLAAAAEAKDPTTGNHMLRCRDLAGDLAAEAGLPADEVADVAWSAMLHDIGKLWVPEHILAKPGPLDPAELELMRTHPARGAELLARSSSFETARRIARWHHENLDGSGYPDGLRGSAIPLEARIVRVVDAWDAMVNDRPYRRALALERAMQELRDGAGTQFDPDLVEIFLRLAERRAALLR